MVPMMNMIACVVTLLVTLVLPVAALIVLAVKNKRQGLVPAWLLGATGFFVTQIVIRVPVLTILQTQPWMVNFSQNHLFAYTFSLAVTAGLFELAGRLSVAKMIGKDLNYKRSLAAGLGHGGIEAMLLVGMTYINNLIYIIMINSGTFDVVLAEAASVGADVTRLELIRQQLVGSSPVLFLLAGFERILAMTAHVAMSMLVCYGVAHGKKAVCVLACLGIHTFIDLTAGLTQVLPQTLAYVLIYAILIAVAVVSLLILKRIRCCWKEDDYDPEE